MIGGKQTEERQLKGWVVETLAPGTVRVKSRLSRRLGRAVLALVVGLPMTAVLAVAAYVFATGQLGGVAPAWWRWLMLPFIAGWGLLAAGSSVWALLGVEEWHAGPGVLEIRRSIVGIRWSRRLTSGGLSVVVTREPQAWNLWSALTTPNPRVREVWSLVVRSKGQKRVLASHGGAAELRALGQLLARHTGWPLRARKR